MRLLFCLALSFVSFLALGDVAHADAGAAAVPDPYAQFYPLLAAGIGALGATVRGFTPRDGFWHQWYGHALLTLIGAVLGSLLPVFESGFVSKATLVSALVGGVSTFLSAWKTTGKTTTALAIFLPVLLMPLLSIGCHGYKAPTYATLALMAEGASAAAQATPPACETLENAAVDAAKAKDEATAKSGAIHARCDAALTTLEGAGKGIKAARDAVHDAPDSARLDEAMPWIRAAVTTYCDAAKMLALILPNVKLPNPAGVC